MSGELSFFYVAGNTMDHDNSVGPCDGENALHQQIAVLAAYALVSEGRLDEAEQALRVADGSSQSCASIDVLARIAVQKGDLHQAARLWSEVLDRDPKNEAAQLALSRLRSPWKVCAVFRRLVLLFVVSAIGFLAVIGGWTVYLCGLKTHAESATVIVNQTAPEVAATKIPTAHAAILVEGLPPPPSMAIERLSALQPIFTFKLPTESFISDGVLSTNWTETKIISAINRRVSTATSAAFQEDK